MQLCNLVVSHYATLQIGVSWYLCEVTFVYAYFTFVLIHIITIIVKVTYVCYFCTDYVYALFQVLIVIVIGGKVLKIRFPLITLCKEE